jgi:lipopolysaccharide transport system ATP-binding protein
MSAIIVDNISKKFRIPHEKKTTVFQNVIGLIKRQFDYEEFWALKDISFEVNKGEAQGIIGRNGSGKSTLLKILARVLYPESGSVSLNGKVASFLELGVGFQPELTARENVYIYSSVLGLSRRQVDKVYDAIFDFAELKKFENMKLKNFSSGMYLRLAFSTAIHAVPDTLLIDEVFAVGDEAFQKKCRDKMNQFKIEGKTIIFVSHALDAVKELCQRAILLNEGRIVTMGDTEKVINDYRAMLQKGTPL